MDSIKTLSQYLGYTPPISVRQDHYNLKTGSLRNYLRSAKGELVWPPINNFRTQLISSNSGFWRGFRSNLRKAIAQEEGKSVSDIGVELESFSVESGQFANSNAFFRELCSNDRIVIKGTFTLEIEGVVPWPAPDPDLVFSWTLEFRFTDSYRSIQITLNIIFEGVEGPGLGWILAIIGFLLTGNIFGAIAGLGVGEFIDLQYEKPERQDAAIAALNSGYDDLEEKGIFDELFEQTSLQIDRPSNKRFRITKNVSHVPSAAEGLHGLACQIGDIIKWIT